MKSEWNWIRRLQLENPYHKKKKKIKKRKESKQKKILQDFREILFTGQVWSSTLVGGLHALLCTCWDYTN